MRLGAVLERELTSAARLAPEGRSDVHEAMCMGWPKERQSEHRVGQIRGGEVNARHVGTMRIYLFRSTTFRPGTYMDSAHTLNSARCVTSA